MVAGQMTSPKSDVVPLSAQEQHHDQRMSEFERQLKDITAGRSTGSGAASSAASSETPPEPASGSGTVHPLKNQRTMLVVGGLGHDTERDVICEKSQASKTGGLRGRSDQWETMLGPSSVNTRAGSSPTDQSSCGTPGIALQRKSSSPRGSHWRSTPHVVGR